MHLFRRAAALEPKVPNVWMHYGACLQDLHRYDESREAFLMVHRALPEDPMPPANVAASFVQQGKAADAVEWADKSLALNKLWRQSAKDPNLAARAEHIAHVSRSYGCLALGRWSEGWKSAQYLYGDTIRTRVYSPPGREEPEWDGSPGKTVVVQADQGMGDMVMFAQCLPQMIAVCKKVIIETDARLACLFERNFPEADVYGTLYSDKVPWPRKYEIDARIHISYLAKFYRTKDEDFPRVAYLKADPEKSAKWHKWLEQFPRPWVGVAWRGGIQITNEASRSINLEDLAPVLKSGGTMVSLAYQDVGREIAVWNMGNREQIRVPDIDPDGDYDETVALISVLDEVVTVTTTVAHVCGALGKKASVLVNQTPQWRYCYGGDHLIWYPNSLTLYRQAHGEVGWQHAIGRLSKDRNLIALAA